MLATQVPAARGGRVFKHHPKPKKKVSFLQIHGTLLSLSKRGAIYCDTLIFEKQLWWDRSWGNDRATTRGKLNFLGAFLQLTSSSEELFCGGEKLSPKKLTWHWKITIFNRRYVFKWLFVFCFCVVYPFDPMGFITIMWGIFLSNHLKQIQG